MEEMMIDQELVKHVENLNKQGQVMTLAPGKIDWKKQGPWTQTALGSSPGSTTY